MKVCIITNDIKIWYCFVFTVFHLQVKYGYGHYKKLCRVCSLFSGVGLFV